MGQTNESRARSEVASVNAISGEDEREPLCVGILTPLSGPGDAVAGETTVRGACLGAQWLHEHGGLPVRFVLANDQATAATEGMQRSAAGEMVKLAVIDRVLAVVGQWHLRTAPYVAEVAEAHGVPIFIENGHSTITGHRRRTLFRTYFTVADRVPLMLGFLAAHGLTRPAVVGVNTVFSSMMGDTIEAQATGLALLRLEVDQETATDVSALMRAVRDFRPDVLINAGVVRTNYLIIEAARAAGLLPGLPMLVTFAFPMRSADYWALSGGEPGNLVVWPSTRFRPGMPGLTGMGRWFIDRYVERYGSLPPDNALSAFTDVTIIGQAAARSGTRVRDDLIAVLESSEFDSWRGPIGFGRGAEHWHHSPPEVVLMQYQRVGQTLEEASIVWPAAPDTEPWVPPAMFSAAASGTR